MEGRIKLDWKPCRRLGNQPSTDDTIHILKLVSLLELTTQSQVYYELSIICYVVRKSAWQTRAVTTWAFNYLDFIRDRAEDASVTPLESAIMIHSYLGVPIW